MTMFPFLQLDEWRTVETQRVLALAQQMATKQRTGTRSVWFNDGSISPLQLYCYLKSRFGNPNGFQMLLRAPTSDNLIHWHFTVECTDTIIDLMGMNYRAEIHVSYREEISKETWVDFVRLLQADMTRHAANINRVKQSLEKWTLFSNPYKRLSTLIEDYEKELHGLALEKLAVPTIPPSFVSETEMRKCLEEWERASETYQKAKKLIASIRLLTPVLGEAFVNFLLFTAAKEEIKKDPRLYEDTLRRQIDVRIKTLHLNCEGFDRPISGDSKEFKAFHRLMMERNDALHGNIRPEREGYGLVYFDLRFIPLLDEQKSIFQASLETALGSLDPSRVLENVKTVREFVDWVLSHLEERVKKQIQYVLDCDELGYRLDNGRVGAILPDYHADFWLIGKSVEKNAEGSEPLVR